MGFKNKREIKSKNLFKNAIKSSNMKTKKASKGSQTSSSTAKYISSKILRLSNTKGIHPNKKKSQHKTMLKIAKKPTKDNGKNKFNKEMNLKNKRKKQSLKSIHFLKYAVKRVDRKKDLKTVAKKVDKLKEYSKMNSNKRHLKSANILKLAIKPRSPS